MQTFLPYKSYKQSAKVLDRQRLGKQRVENLQILKALSNPEYGWQNHPAVKMWRGHEGALFQYQIAICSEWTSRGYKDTCMDKSYGIFPMQHYWDTEAKPEWLGNEAIHISHRSNLLRKNPEHYGTLFEDGLPDDLEYVWPV